VRGSHELVALDSCWIADDAFGAAFASSWDGAEEVELRAIGEGEPFAVVRRDTHRGTMFELCSLRGEPLEPSTQSRVKVDGHVFSVSPRSFWQSHRSAPALLVEAVKNYADVNDGDHVVDLFSASDSSAFHWRRRWGHEDTSLPLSRRLTRFATRDRTPRVWDR